MHHRGIKACLIFVTVGPGLIRALSKFREGQDAICQSFFMKLKPCTQADEAGAEHVQHEVRVRQRPRKRDAPSGHQDLVMYITLNQHPNEI